MFTLKLYRRVNGNLITRIVACASISVKQIAKNTDELWAFHDDKNAEGGSYHVYYIGERKPEMTAIDDYNHFEWALLENWEGNTTQHIRPHNYG